MFNVSKEISLYDFEAWSGGKDRLDKAIELDVVGDLENYIFEMFGDSFSEGDLNDILWFEVDEFLEDFEMDED